MAEYIKREDVIKAITRKHDEVLSVAEVIEDLESVPSADVVSREDFEDLELVCKNYYEDLELVCKNYEEALKDAVDELEAMDDYSDICYECGGYGDDYYFDDDGELVCACAECWVTKMRKENSDD